MFCCEKAAICIQSQQTYNIPSASWYSLDENILVYFTNNVLSTNFHVSTALHIQLNEIRVW